MPIGGVAAYQNQVSVLGVGFDIADVLTAHYPRQADCAMLRSKMEENA
ncbi:MAG: hypothetical protein WBW04_23460 [Nitrolancea sp.]